MIFPLGVSHDVISYEQASVLVASHHWWNLRVASFYASMQFDDVAKHSRGELGKVLLFII